MASWLVGSLVATPMWPIARRLARQPLRDRLTVVSMLAIGAFSSLFVFTFIRDVALLVSAT
ncbi:MAG: metallophosphoesterase, partial [Burkholderiales bacterium]